MLTPLRYRPWLLLALGIFFGASSALSAAPADEGGPFDPGTLMEISDAIDEAIEAGKMPGGVFWLERKGGTFSTVAGHRAVEPEQEEMTVDTIFDAASLTKVVATTPSILLLVERGEMELDDPVATHIPEFGRKGKESITVKQLMTHTSGLPPGLSLIPEWSGVEHAIELACDQELREAPGEAFIYSDINFILLAEIVHRVSGRPVNEFVREEIHEPLGMLDTRFLPPSSEIDRIAPTQRTSSGMLRGEVHDPTARAMGGVAGHAGLFLTAEDLARFARMMLNGGELKGTRVLAPETVELMTSVQTPDEVDARRGLGWDIDSRFSAPRGSIFPLGSYGHTGWTGGSVWIDPHSKSFWILLSSRVHPDGKGNVVPFRRVLGDLSAKAVTGFHFSDVPDALPPRAEEEEGG